MWGHGVNGLAIADPSGQEINKYHELGRVFSGLLLLSQALRIQMCFVFRRRLAFLFCFHQTRFVLFINVKDGPVLKSTMFVGILFDKNYKIHNYSYVLLFLSKFINGKSLKY